MIGAAEANELQPGCTRPWKGALYTPDDARAEPFLAVPLMAEALQAQGRQGVHAMRGARAGDEGGPRLRGGDGAGFDRLRHGGAGGRRVVPPLLRESRDCAAAAHRRQFGDADGAPRHGARRARVPAGTSPSASAWMADTPSPTIIISVADIVPDSFRLFRDFLPALMLDWKGLRLRLGKRFIDEARLKRRWALDEVSPFELVRVLDPEPVQDILDDAREAPQGILSRVQADEDRGALGGLHRCGAGCGAGDLEGRRSSRASICARASQATASGWGRVRAS